MEYNRENPIYPKLTTYDTRRLHDIQHKLRIYQFDAFTETEPDPDRIEQIGDQIVRFNELLLIREEEDYG